MSAIAAEECDANINDAANEDVVANENESEPEDRILYEESYRPPFTPFVIFSPFWAVVMWNYHVRVSENKGLSFGYKYGWSNQVERSQIISMEIIDHQNPLWQFGGWGIVKNLRWETGYVTKSGPAIRLVLEREGKNYTYIFNCDDPKKVIDLLQPRADAVDEPEGENDV